MTSHSTTADINTGRRRLLALTGHSMAFTSLAALSACGGGDGISADAGGSAGGGGSGGGTGGGMGGGTGGGTGGTTPAADFLGNGVAGAGTAGAAVSPAQRVAALDTVSAALAALAGGAALIDNTALARQLQAMPAFQRVGVSSRMQNVWALFTDGRSLVVPNNLEPGATTAAGSALPLQEAGVPRRATALAARALAASTRIPLPALLVQNQYRQVDMLGDIPLSASPEAAHLCQDSIDRNTLPNLRLMAMGRGFKLPASQLAQPPSDGTYGYVENLRNLSGDGLFFLTACSAEVGSTAQPQTVICVDSPANEANEAAFSRELGGGRLAYAVRLRGNGTGWVPVKTLALTPAFAADNWAFPTECIGILNLTGGSILAEWAPVLRQCGLLNVFTWDKPVSWKRMVAFADDLLQIELGTNNFDGRTVLQKTPPRLRAYGVGATLEYLMGRHLVDDAAGRANAVFLQEKAPDRIVSVLLPTIDYVTIKEGTLDIELVGQFGRSQGAFLPSEVRFGKAQGAAFASPLLARAADPLISGDTVSGAISYGDLIVGTLRPTDLDRGGYVQVLNGDRWSNIAPITHWEIRVQAITTISGGLTETFDLVLHLRADVRGYRLQPDGQPWNGAPTIIMSSMGEGSAQVTGSGEIAQTVQGDTTTISWSGSGGTGSTAADPRVQLAGTMEWATRKLTAVLAVPLAGMHQQRTRVTRYDPEIGIITIKDETVNVGAGVVAPSTTSAPLVLAFDERWRLLAGSLTLPPEPYTLLGERTRGTVLNWAAALPDFPPDEANVGGI